MAAIAEPRRDGKRKVTFVSVYHAYRVIIAEDVTELKQMEHGKFRSTVLRRPQVLEFRDHFAERELTPAELDDLRSRPEYTFKWLCMEDLAKLQENAPTQYEGFIEEGIRRSKQGQNNKFTRQALKARMKEAGYA